MANEEVKYTLSLNDLLTGKVRQADGAVNKFETSLGRAQGAANSLASAVGVAFGAAAVVAFGSRMVEAGTKVENALTGLTTLLKDGAEAQQVINNTMEDATRTPFAFEGLLNANKALISAGVSADGARADVLNLANAIAATGGGDDELQRMVVNLQQIRNTGKATALDIKQFAYAGVNVYKVLADATNQPIEKVKDMEVSYDMLTYALRKAHEEGGIYMNGLENMQANTSVRISNLGDSVFQLSVKMFNDLKPAIDTIISGLGNLVSNLTAGWNWLVRNKDMIAAIAGGITIAAAAVGIYSAVVNASAIATGIATAATAAWNAVLMANPIGLIITGLGLMVAGIIRAYQTIGTFRAILWATWAVIKEFGLIVADVFTGLGKTIHGALTFNPAMVLEGANQTINAVKDAATRIGKAAKDGYEAGLADFAKDQAKATVKAPGNVAPNKGGIKPGGAPEMKSETKGAQGQKAVTINVSIGNLVKDLQIQTTNITEGAAKLREMVAQALISATNDSQIIAGQ